MMTAHAQEAEKNAVYAWVNGTGKCYCYCLTAMPKISYDKGTAVLSVNGVEQLRVPAEGIGRLVIAYGVYKQTPTATGPAESSDNGPVRQVGKYIMGGQLIVVVDGVQYDVHGRRL